VADSESADCACLSCASIARPLAFLHVVVFETGTMLAAGLPSVVETRARRIKNTCSMLAAGKRRRLLL
jgi:hypothetical protein